MKFDSLIDCNGMSTRLGLLYADKFENRVHCMFIFTCFDWLFLAEFFLLLGSNKYE